MKYSKDGYKRTSKDKNNPYNIIPSGNITMKGVDFPVFGMDNLGNSRVMMPGANYTFPGSSVFEVPLVQRGGGLKQKDPNRKYNNTVSPLGKTGYAEIRDENLEIPNPNKGKYIYDFNFQNGGDIEDEAIGQGFDPEMMFRDKYNTELTEDELTQFTEWVKSESARQGRDIMMDMGAYDIQGFWKSGDFEKMDEDNHGSDKWKKPNHPTFSNQSVYHNVDGFQGGTWQDDGGYIPSEHTKKLYDAEYYNWLFGREPHRPEYLVLPKNQRGGSLPKYQGRGETVDGIPMFDPDFPIDQQAHIWVEPSRSEQIAVEARVRDVNTFPTPDLSRALRDINVITSNMEATPQERTKQELDEAVNFAARWMSSPRYVNMLLGSGGNDWWNSEYDIAKSRINNLYNLQEDVRFISEDPKNSYTEDEILGVGGYSYTNSGDVYVNDNRAIRPTTIFDHEFSHSIDRPRDQSILQSGINFIARGAEGGPRLIPDRDVDLIGNLVNNYISIGEDDYVTFWKKYGDTPEEGTRNYFAEPTEVRARLNEIRRLMYDEGIDVFNKKITSSDLDKVMGSHPVNGLQNVFSNRSIIQLLNEISMDAPEEDELPINDETLYELPAAQLGIESYVAPSDNTRVATPPIIDPNIQLQKEEEVPLPPQDQGTIRPYEEPSLIEKGMSYLANPMTSLGYIVRGQDLPDRIPMDAPNRNPYDYAFDVLNPFAFLGYGDAAIDDVKQGEYVDAAFNALGAVPFIPAGVQAGKPVIQTGKTVGKNIIKDVDLAVKRSKIKSGVPKTDEGTFKYVEDYINDPAYQKYVNTEQVRLARDFNEGNLRIGLNQNRPAGYMFRKGNPIDAGYVPTIHDKINFRQSYEDILNITRPVRDDGIQVLGRYPDIKFPGIDDIAANALGNKFSNTYLQLGKDIFGSYPTTLSGRFDATKKYLDSALNTTGVYYHPAAGSKLGNKFYTNRVGSFGNTQGTNIHEWSHFMDAGSGRLSRQQRSDLRGLVNTDLLKSSSKSGKNSRFDFGYYTQPTEMKARMMEERLRLGLKPSDPYTLKHFETAGDLSGMRKYLNLKDPQNFINIMNKYYQKGGDLSTAQEGEETVSFDDLERGIRHTESLNGVLMLNPESSATGLYGQLWSEIKDQYDGTREEFAEDTDFQKDLFRKRAYGELEGIPGLLLAGEELYNEYKDVDHGMSMLDIAALSNFLGRQGAREYIGYHIRDGKSLETVFPKLYGENAEYSNKTPDEYIETFRKGVLEDKKSGGEFMRKMNRLKQQLDLYNRGGVISPIAKKELEERGLIEPVIMRVGGSYTIKSGDTLGRIARDNGLTLKELVDLNPKFRGREGMIRPGEQVFFDVNSKNIAESNNPVLKHRVKRGESLSAIANRYKVSVAEIAELNNITNPSLILVDQKLIIPQHSQYEETESTKSQEAAAVSPITTIDEVVVNDTTPVNEVWVKREKDENGVWRTVSGKKLNIQEINKLDQFQTIVQGMNDEYGVDEEKEEKVYTVKAGDNLTKIAEKEGVSVGRLMADNGISRQDQNNLRVGQKLTINRSASNAYLILDEKKGKIHLLYPGEETPRQSYDVLTGQATGDAATVTKVAVYYKGKKLSQKELNEAMKDNGVSTIDELIKVPGYRTKVDWKSGNKQTGAGVYTISSAKADGGRAYGADTRADVPSFTFENEDGISQSMAFHGVTRGRVSNLYDNDGTNNRLTNGCINGKCTDLQELYDNPDVGVGTMLYVLPEDEDNAFVYENGKLNLYASKENIEKAETSYDQLNSKGEVIGQIEGGQGINTSINNLYNYKPIMFEYNNDIAEESGYIDGTAGNRLEEYNEITKPFLNALANNKKGMMEILNIDGDLYNDIALTAFGIYGYESGMGDRNDWVSDHIKIGTKWLTGEGSSGSVERKYEYANNPYNSVGWTQLRVADGNTDPRERELLAEADKRFKTNFTTPIETKLSQAEIDLLSPDEYKIAEANDFKGRVFSYNDGENTISQYHQFDINNSELMDPEKSAIATALILGNRYQTQISREEKNSEDFDVYTSLAKTWRPGKKADDYARFVNNHIPIVTLSETNIDNMDEKVVTKEEPKSNWEIFQDNAEEAWDTFTNMMVRSAKTMLRPIGFSYGGEFGLQNQIQFYNDYVRGVYDNTQQSKSAKKLYDKINRMYYNDYKGTKMNALDVMNRMNTPPNN